MRGMIRIVAKRAPRPVRWAISKEALAPLLVLVLFVCQGTFGATHQVMTAGTGPVPAAEVHPSQAIHGGEGGQGLVMELFFSSFLMGHVVDDGGWSVLGQAAALLFTVAAFFWSLLKGIPRWRETLLPGPPLRVPYPAAPLHRPPGPAIPALQVFRL